MAFKRRRGSTFKRAFKRKRVTPVRSRRKRHVALLTGTKKTIRLRFCSVKTIDAGAGGQAHFSFRANGMFDPDFAVGGHQPKGFDQYMLFYTHYTVVSATCNVTFISQTDTSAGTGMAIVGIKLDNDDSMFTVASGLLEEPNVRINYLGPATGSRAIVHAKSTYNARRFFGKKFVVGADDMMGSAIADPTTPAFFNVFVSSLNGTLDPNGIIARVCLTYTAVLTERKELAQS